jgi:hypothetical protein
MPVTNRSIRAQLILAGVDPDTVDLDAAPEQAPPPVVKSEPLPVATPPPVEVKKPGLMDAVMNNGILGNAFQLLGKENPVDKYLPASILAGLGVGIGTGLGKEALVEALPESISGNYKAQKQEDVTQHPTATRIGSALGALPFMRPGLNELKIAATGLGKLPRAGITLSNAEKNALLNTSLNTVIPGASEVGVTGIQNLAAGKPITENMPSMGDLAISSLFGLGLNTPTKSGQRLGLTPTPEQVKPFADADVLKTAQAEAIRQQTETAKASTKFEEKEAANEYYSNLAKEREAALAQKKIEAEQARAAKELQVKAEQDRVRAVQAEQQAKLRAEAEATRIAAEKAQAEAKEAEAARLKAQYEADAELLNQATLDKQMHLEAQAIETDTTLAPEVRKAKVQEVVDKYTSQGLKFKKQAQVEPPESAITPIMRGAPSREWMDESIALGKMRGIEVKEAPVQQGAIGEIDLNTRVANIDTPSAGLDTPPHEIQHGMIRDIQTRGTKQERNMLYNAIKAVRNDNEFKVWLKENKKNYPNRFDQVEEFLVTKTGDDFVKRVMGNEGPVKKFFNDVVAGFRSKTGTADVNAHARNMSDKLLNDAPFNETFGARQDIRTKPTVTDLKKENEDLDAIETTKFQKKHQDTPEFKEWFGKSVMIKPDTKEPIIMYHGTKSNELTAFSKDKFQASEANRGGEGFYFTNKPGAAEPYTAGRETNYETSKARVGEYYLKMENPAPADLVKEWHRKIFDAESSTSNREKGNAIVKQMAREMREDLQSKGYDGYVNVGQHPNNLHEVVVFEPTQIKSATGNEGTYNSRDPDIRKSMSSNFNKAVDFIHQKTIASEHDKLRANPDPDAQKLAGGFDNFTSEYANKRGQFSETFQHDVIKKLDLNLKGVLSERYWKQSAPELRELDNYMSKLHEGATLPKLTSKAQEILDLWKAKAQDVRNELRARPGIRNIIGTTDNPNYFPQMISRDVVRELRNNPQSAKSKQLKDEYLAYATSKLRDVKKANEFLKGSIEGLYADPKNVRFGPLDESQGIGLPPSWREKSFLNTATKYLDRSARRLAFHDAIEKPLAKEFETYQGNDSVQAIMSGVLGTYAQDGPILNGVLNAVRSFKLGTLTGAKDVTTSPFLGWQHFDNPIHAASVTTRSLGRMKENIADAYKNGRIRNHLAEFELQDHYNTISDGLRRISNIANDLSGRNTFEKIARGVAQGQGYFATLDFMSQIQSGNPSKQAKAWFENFGEGTNWKSGLLTSEEVNKIAGNFVDSVQGTYSLKGLPAWTQEGQLAPVFALSRWSIEKANNFKKYTVDPLTKNRNVTPLINTLFAGLIGGTAATSMAQLITGRKQKTAEWEEIMASEEKSKALMYKLASISAAAGHMGIVGDTIHNAIAVTYGRNPPSEIESVLISFASSNLRNVNEFVKAANDDGLTPDLLTAFGESMLQDNIQTVRLLSSYLTEDNRKQLDKSNKLRDLRVFSTIKGKDVADFSGSFDKSFKDLEAKDFKEETDVKKIAEKLPEIYRKAFADSNGDFDDFKKKLEKFKGARYPTMPNPDKELKLFSEYYNFLKETQGEEEAKNRVTDYLQRQLLNEVKTDLLSVE